MKKTLRVLAVIMVICMGLSLLAGCGNKEAAVDTSEYSIENAVIEESSEETGESAIEESVSEETIAEESSEEVAESEPVAEEPTITVNEVLLSGLAKALLNGNGISKETLTNTLVEEGFPATAIAEVITEINPNFQKQALMFADNAVAVSEEDVSTEELTTILQKGGFNNLEIRYAFTNKDKNLSSLLVVEKAKFALTEEESAELGEYISASDAISEAVDVALNPVEEEVVEEVEYAYVGEDASSSSESASSGEFQRGTVYYEEGPAATTDVVLEDGSTHTHVWQYINEKPWIEEISHDETVEEEKTRDTVYYYCTCGEQFGTLWQAQEHIAFYEDFIFPEGETNPHTSYTSSVETETYVITHTVHIIDQKGHWGTDITVYRECTICGYKELAPDNL